MQALVASFEFTVSNEKTEKTRGSETDTHALIDGHQRFI